MVSASLGIALLVSRPSVCGSSTLKKGSSTQKRVHKIKKISNWKTTSIIGVRSAAALVSLRRRRLMRMANLRRVRPGMHLQTIGANFGPKKKAGAEAPALVVDDLA